MNKYIVDIVLLVWRTMFDRYYIDLYGLITFEQCASCGKYSYGSNVNARCSDCLKSICTQCNQFGYCSDDFHTLQADQQRYLLKIENIRTKIRNRIFLFMSKLVILLIIAGFLILTPYFIQLKSLFEFTFIVLFGVNWASILIWIWLEWYYNILIKKKTIKND